VHPAWLCHEEKSAMQLTDFGKSSPVRPPPSPAFDAVAGEETLETVSESELVASDGDFDADDVYRSLSENDQAIWNGAIER